MSDMKRAPRPLLVFTALLFGLSTGTCGAATALIGQADDTRELDCLITNDFYAVHLTAYQVPAEVSSDAVKAGFKPYCRELPNAGKTYITLDLLDPDVRNAPMTVRVLRERDDGPPVTLTELPRRTYPAGVVEAVADLPEPGRYRVVLEMGETKASEDVITIPVTVVSPHSMAPVLLALLALAVVGGLAVLLPRLRLQQGSIDPWKPTKGST
ncbi:MAG: hypothetical protein ACT4QB_14210 [Gammaproteobacteria bacterium]